MTHTIHTLIAPIRNFLNRLFMRLRISSPAKSPAESPEVTQNKAPRPPRKHNKEKTKTFSDLLDNIEYAFNSVKLPTMKESWLERDSIIGLKKLGVHVPNPWVMFDRADAKVDVSKTLPAIMCISASTAHTVDTKDKYFPKILFAVKLTKLPWQVAHKAGTPYQFGAAFEVEGKLFWFHLYMTVAKSTGEIRFCDELRVKAHVVSRSKTFFNKAWSSPSYLEDDARTPAESEHIVKNLFVSMHEWWLGRDSRWNVVVKKNGDRVTFGIDNSHTPYYFKDRDKSVKTASGQTKKIVHYVKTHERKVNDTTTAVKEHIRGLQEFNWASYNCQVVSPKLQAKTSATFIAPGQDDLGSSNNVVYLSKVGKLLADAEERKAVA